MSSKINPLSPLNQLSVKKLDERATLPTVAYAGSDLGYDVYALENVLLYGMPVKVRTGIAIALHGHGFKVFDRSSVSARGIITVGGVIDEGYRGEIFVNLLNIAPKIAYIRAGDKIAQLVPMFPQTHYPVVEVSELPLGDRGDKGYGSSGE
jgi:dUTP pyrophosphatase